MLISIFSTKSLMSPFLALDLYENISWPKYNIYIRLLTLIFMLSCHLAFFSLFLLKRFLLLLLFVYRSSPSLYGYLYRQKASFFVKTVIILKLHHSHVKLTGNLAKIRKIRNKIFFFRTSMALYLTTNFVKSNLISNFVSNTCSLRTLRDKYFPE